MKNYSSIDWWAHLIFLLGILVFVLILQQYSIFAVIILVGVVLWISIYTHTTYLLTEDKLIYYVGFYRQEIKYYNITKVEICDHFSIAPALSVKRIAVNQRNKGKKGSILEISPKNREVFFKELNERIAYTR
ncbi:MAG: PH domain-containing protein [Culicoidibacterales bacterium]